MKVTGASIIALLGANGAGKTTTLKAISGLLGTELGEVTDGAIYFDEVRIDHMRPEEVVGLGIVQVMEGRRILEHLTAEENLRLGAYTHKGNFDMKRELDMVYSYFPVLRGLRHRVSGFLSGGEQQMLVIGRGLMAKPRLMLLDEASLGLAPLMTKEIFRVVKLVNQDEKVGVMLVEQNAQAALKVAEYGYVMENGRVVFDGPSQKLLDNPDVREFYLGLSAVGSEKSYRDVKHYKRRRRWLG